MRNAPALTDGIQRDLTMLSAENGEVSLNASSQSLCVAHEQLVIELLPRWREACQHDQVSAQELQVEVHA